MSTQLDNAKLGARLFLRRTLWIVLVASIIFSIGYFFYRTYTISEGSRSGTLFKISKKGVMFKTYEGQLHLSGSVMLTSQSTWDFSAVSAAVYKDLQKYEGKNVKCYYKEKINAFVWQGDTDYLVYRVELIQ